RAAMVIAGAAMGIAGARREARLALADPALRGPAAAASRLRISAEPARRPIPAGRPPGGGVHADHVRRATREPRKFARQGRGAELLGVVVQPGLLRGSPRARTGLACLA